MAIGFGASAVAGVTSVVLALSAAAGAAEAPKRVVSVNVCTDQLAMLVAGEGQLHSVSYLARDPLASVLSEQAPAYPVNHGLAEEVFLMHPDLVLAGTYTTRSTVDLLRRLGVRVEEFAPETSIEDIRVNILRMGEVLGRQQRAADLVARFDKDLAALAANRPPRRTVALYYANSYTSGAGTLVGAIVAAAGLDNLADRLDLAGTAKLPLELLVLAAPDLVADGADEREAPALAEENFRHPAYRALLRTARRVSIPGPYTICGAPFTLEAAQRLQAATIAGGRPE